MKASLRNYRVLVVVVLTFNSSCESNLGNPDPVASIDDAGFKTRNIVLVVIDGPRFKETWGDPSKQYIPYFANELAEVGINHNRFYNRGATYTTSGHAALTTGNYQWMANDGSEIPFHPSIFQAWLQDTQENSNKALIVTSKKKLEVLGDCVSPELRGRFNPMVDAVDRADSITLETALATMQLHHPRMTLIHFRGPDMYGHANDWENYLKSIRETDEFTYEIWTFIQNNPFYKDATALMVTNDHGRHNDGVRDGFVSHGCFCSGCTHINLYVAGPDFHANQVANQPRQSVDIAPTIAALMGIEHKASTGSVMWELFKNNP